MDWIRFIHEDENKALEQIYKRNKGECLAYLIRTYNLSYEDSLDVFQNSVLILYDQVISRQLKEYRGEIGAYLMNIVKNKGKEFNRLSYKRRSTELNIVYEDYSREEDAQFEYRVSILKKALDTIGNPCKKLLELHYFKRLSTDAIMNKMNYTNKNTLKTKKYKCIKRLQISFNNMFNNEVNPS